VGIKWFPLSSEPVPWTCKCISSGPENSESPTSASRFTVYSRHSFCWVCPPWGPTRPPEAYNASSTVSVLELVMGRDGTVIALPGPTPPNRPVGLFWGWSLPCPCLLSVPSHSVDRATFVTTCLKRRPVCGTGRAGGRGREPQEIGSVPEPFSLRYGIFSQRYRVFSDRYRLFSEWYRIFSKLYRVFSWGSTVCAAPEALLRTLISCQLTPWFVLIIVIFPRSVNLLLPLLHHSGFQCCSDRLDYRTYPNSSLFASWLYLTLWQG